MKDRDRWELEAERWTNWARTPGHDAYWYYRHAFFDGLVPVPGRITLEIGCGEGRVTRDLASRGHRVIAVDGAVTLLRHAHRSMPGGRYARCDAESLPVGSGRVDLVVAYNSLMDFDDLSGAVCEIARVLEQDGVFCLCITHPAFDSVRFDEGGAPYLLDEGYLGPRRFDETFTRDGLTVRFSGWSRPIEAYADALAGAGFVIDRLREPRPLEGTEWYGRRCRYPMFLHLRAVKRGGRE